MTGRPEVSVCIPARDAAGHVGAAVRSALAQDAELEVVVVDDGSTDGTAVAAREAAGEDGRLRVVAAAGGAGGVAAARERCLAHARGTHVAWLDADDELLAGALRGHLDLLAAEPDVALVHGRAEIVDAAGRRLPDWAAPAGEDLVEPAHLASRQLAAGNEIITSTVVVRSGALRRAGGFDAAIGASSTDWDAWLRVALDGAVAYRAAPVARYRQHERSISRRTTRTSERLRCDARVVAGVVRRAPDLAEIARAALVARGAVHAGDRFTAGHAAQAAGVLGSLVPYARGAAAAPLDELRRAVADRDDLACSTRTKDLLRALAVTLDGTRAGARLAGIAAIDPAWDAVVGRAARAVRAATPDGARVAAATKWDPALLRRAGRSGVNFPDRTLLPGGYPDDDAAALGHLHALQRERGVTHVAFTSATLWWLDAYPALGEHLRGACRTVHADADCSVFALAEAAA